MSLAICLLLPALGWRAPFPRMSVSPAVESLNARRDRLLNELADVNQALRPMRQSSFSSVAKVGSQQATSVFEPSFGYLSRSAGVYTEAQSAEGSNLPSNAFDLATQLAGASGGSSRSSGGNDSDQIRCSGKGDCTDDCEQPTFQARRARPQQRRRVGPRAQARGVGWQGGGAAPAARSVLLRCWCLDVFEDRPLSRFWFLETVARMPYFSYVSMLHLYESLGWWRRSAETKRVHFAGNGTSFHHLLTMEALGGDQLWRDRFLAQHAAIAYYWILVALWLLSPSLAYNFSELIEAHAVDTYGEFVDANSELLATLPAPRVSRLYYNGPDLFLFDEFQTSRARLAPPAVRDPARRVYEYPRRRGGARGDYEGVPGSKRRRGGAARVEPRSSRPRWASPRLACSAAARARLATR